MISSIKTHQTFAHVYKNVLQHLIKKFPAPHNHPLPYQYEAINYSIPFNASKLSIYSEKSSRTFPLVFALAEMCWVLSGQLSPHPLLKPLTYPIINLLSPYNMNTSKYIPAAIGKLIGDTTSYETTINMIQMSDLIHPTSDFPRTSKLQFMTRDNTLSLMVSSQSSDILSALPIDAFQWQCTYRLILNEINEIALRPLRPGMIYYNIGSLYMTQADYQHYKRFNFHPTHFEHQFSLFQSYSNAQLRASKRFDDATSVTALLDILDLGTITKITSIQKLFKRRVFQLPWENF